MCQHDSYQLFIQDDPLKLGVDLDMFHMGGGGGGGYQHHSMGSSDMHNNATASAGSWHRDHYGMGDDEEEDEDDDDDDFMFHGPGGASGNTRTAQYENSHHPHDDNSFSPDAGATGGFPVNFDAFSQRQNFTSSGFDLSAGEVVVASFADFASFDDDFRVGSASPDSFAQPVPFDDFANFAEFDAGPLSEVASIEKSVDSKDGDIDFAPSEF